MRIYKLTCFAQDLSAAIATGRFQHISYDDVWKHIEDGSIFNYLHKLLGFSVAISAVSPVDKLELLLEWESFRGCVEPYKFNSHRNGLCLLIGYLLEGIARRAQHHDYRLSEETCGAAVPQDRFTG